MLPAKYAISGLILSGDIPRPMRQCIQINERVFRCADLRKRADIALGTFQVFKTCSDLQQAVGGELLDKFGFIVLLMLMLIGDWTANGNGDFEIKFLADSAGRP